MIRQVFVTGGTGYVGSRLVAELVARGHAVRALVRPGSERKLPPGADTVTGDALDHATFAGAVRTGDTFVQLVGTPHLSPRKAAQFRAVDLVSARESVAAAKQGEAAHFVYVGVAHPAAVMRAYQEVRIAGEAMVREAGLAATFVRPWYVLGPGHRWPCLLLPLYALLERVPATRGQARRLGLVTLDDMVAALVLAVESPLEAVRVVGSAARAGGSAPRRPERMISPSAAEKSAARNRPICGHCPVRGFRIRLRKERFAAESAALHRPYGSSRAARPLRSGGTPFKERS